MVEEFQEGELVSVTVPEELMLTDCCCVLEMLGLWEGVRLRVLVRVLVCVLEGVREIVVVRLGLGVPEELGVEVALELDDGLIEGLIEEVGVALGLTDTDA